VDAREPRAPVLDCVIVTIGATPIEPKQKFGRSDAA
jgi:hypothetical protein